MYTHIYRKPIFSRPTILIDCLSSNATVVCGMARGADLDGKLWAQYCGIRYKEFPPDWERYGKQAGFIRNQEMADHADGAVLFPGGRGTADMKLRSMKTFPADRIFDFTGGTGLF